MPENMLTRRLGPLPTWGWLGIATGGGILVYLTARKRKTAAATAPGQTAAANVPDYIFQNYNQLPQNTPPPAPATTGTPTPATVPGPVPDQRMPPSPAGGLTVTYLPGGFPGGLPAATAAGSPKQTSGGAYNFSWDQIQQLGFPNLRGMTLQQARQALQSYGGGAYTINNVSGNQAGKIVSFTPYSTGQVNVGLA